MSQRYIVYQAYGIPGVLAEARYSLLSFLRVADHGTKQRVTLLVYTDQPDQFVFLQGSNVDHKIHQLTPERLRAWRGPFDFVHRVKIEMLLDVVTHYAGAILYMDTDTVFMEDPAPLFN